MTKHHRRDSIKSLLWSHIDPDKDEQLQGTKIEVEHKVTKILKIIKNVDQDGGGGSREGDSGLELVELVEDLHGQYQTLYALYDNLKKELRKKVHGRKEKDSSSSSSSSDSESFYSSKEVDSNNGNLENELQKQTGHIKQEPEAGNSEATTMEENKALSSEAKAGDTEGEVSTLTESNRAQAYEASARIEELENQVSSLQLELESVLAQERSLEERVERTAVEAKEQFEEILGLRARISELEMTSKEKGDDEIEGGENDAYAQIMALTAEINTLQVELNSLQTSKTQLENQNNELQTMIAEQQRTLQEQDDTINEMNQQCKQVKGLRRQTEMNLQATERKVEEIAGQFRKNMEDSLRLLAQRIRVAERLHYENRDFYRTTREALKQEQKELEENIAAHKAEFRKLKRIITITNDTLSGFDLVAERLSESSGIFLSRISKISEELSSARKWIKGTNNELKELKGEKLNLIKAVTQLEKRVGELEKMVKEKDERVLGLGEEKREAIRQLCIWIDYHRTDLHSLKILAKMSSRRPKTT